MKAIAVVPGKPNSLHLADLPRPTLADVPGGRGVLVRVLRVGVDGTDKEINAAEYGAAPPAATSWSSATRGSGRWRPWAPR
jgi:threonine dehydrogenase-like Zn-dependent dehydrogenase